MENLKIKQNGLNEAEENNPSTNKFWGLSLKEVSYNRTEFGANIITPDFNYIKRAVRIRSAAVLRPTLACLLAIALMIAGASMYHIWKTHEFSWALNIALILVITVCIVNMDTSFKKVYKALSNFPHAGNMNDPLTVSVVREGKKMDISQTQLVVGDIVLVGPGSIIFADGQLLEAENLLVDEKLFTGINLSNKYAFSPNPCFSFNGPQFLLRGSTVKAGKGAYRVIRVGDNTEYGLKYKILLTNCLYA